MDLDIPKYRKKKNQDSKSKNRSDHKHTYETVIVESFPCDFYWTKRCEICGRLMSINFAERRKGLCKDNELRFCSSSGYTAEELHEKYPDVKIFGRIRQEGKLLFGDLDVERLY